MPPLSRSPKELNVRRQIISANGKPEHSIPVSTEAAFGELWKPGIEQLNLQWGDLFQTGLVIQLEDWPAISRELTALREWAKRSHDGDNRDYVTERIDRLLLELPKILADEKLEV